MSRTAPLRLIAVLAPLLFAGCGGGESTPPARVASIGVTLGASTLTPGATTTATAVVRDAQGAVIAGRAPAWSSSNNAVATVTAQGVVTAVAIGSAEITAELDGIRGVAPLSITPPPVATISVSLPVTSLAAGATAQATATLLDAQGATLTGRPVGWSTANPAVASVSGTGLVTGVGAGTTTIVATSEGRTGQAVITVTANIGLSPLTLRRDDGTALDVGNVAGRVIVRAEVDLPPGFRGVRTLRLDTIVVQRDSVFGAATATAATASPFGLPSVARPGAARLATVDLAMETALPVSVLSGETLQSTPRWSNGVHQTVLEIIGTLPSGESLTRTSRQDITLRNANALRLLLRPERRVNGADGRSIATGTITGRIDYVPFDGRALERIEILRADASPVYGSDAVASAVTVITRTGPDVFRPFTIDLSGYESPTIGTRFLLGRVDLAGTAINPRLAPITLDGNRPALDGSGWATSTARAGGFTLGAGIRYQHVPFVTLPALQGFTDASNTGDLFDARGPIAADGFIAPLDRGLTIGQPAWHADRILGLADNFLGPKTTFSSLLRLDRLGPDLSGVTPVEQFEWYCASSLSTLFNASSRIATLDELSPSSSRLRLIGARVSDRAGNWSSFVATTTPGNPYTIGGIPASSEQIGTAPATFGKLGTTGTISLTGVFGDRVFNANALSGATFGLTASGSQWLANGVYGAAYDPTDAATCVRGVNMCATPLVLGGSVSGSVLTYSEPVSTIVSARSAAQGGTGDGIYRVWYGAGDRAGTKALLGEERKVGWQGIVDRVSPTVTGSITVTSPSEVAYRIDATDTRGVESVTAGVQFDFQNGLFPGGFLHAWLDRYEAPGDLTVGLSTNYTKMLAGPPITHGAFFQLQNGAPVGPTFKTLGGVVRARDWAWNASALTFLPQTNAFPAPALPAQTSFHFAADRMTVCRDETCPVGQSSTLRLTLDARAPVATSPVYKVAFQAIPANGGDVYHLGTDYLAETSPTAGVFNHRYTVDWNAALACVPPGAYLLKAFVLLSGTPLALFNNPFIDLTVTGTNSRCTRPARPLLLPMPFDRAPR